MRFVTRAYPVNPDYRPNRDFSTIFDAENDRYVYSGPIQSDAAERVVITLNKHTARGSLFTVRDLIEDLRTDFNSTAQLDSFFDEIRSYFSNSSFTNCGTWITID